MSVQPRLKVNLGNDLALFWKKGVDVDVEMSSLNHIDVLINRGKEDGWRFTGFMVIWRANGEWSHGIS